MDARPNLHRRRDEWVEPLSPWVSEAADRPPCSRLRCRSRRGARPSRSQARRCRRSPRPCAFAGVRLIAVNVGEITAMLIGMLGTTALQVLSEHWPVMDGDEPVSPIRAMNEASSVVAANQIAHITRGRITVAELDGETRMALTMFGIFGFAGFAFDEALNLSRSLGIGLHNVAGGYEVDRGSIG